VREIWLVCQTICFKQNGFLSWGSWHELVRQQVGWFCFPNINNANHEEAKKCNKTCLGTQHLFWSEKIFFSFFHKMLLSVIIRPCETDFFRPFFFSFAATITHHLLMHVILINHFVLSLPYQFHSPPVINRKLTFFFLFLFIYISTSLFPFCLHLFSHKHSIYFSPFRQNFAFCKHAHLILTIERMT